MSTRSALTPEDTLTTLRGIGSFVVHDLATALHVARFCAAEMVPGAGNEAVMGHLQESTERAVALVEVLRGLLRDGTGVGPAADFGTVHRYVCRLLEHWQALGGGQPEVMLERPDGPLVPCVAALDLAHLCLHLYATALGTAAHGGAVRLRVSLQGAGTGRCRLSVSGGAATPPPAAADLEALEALARSCGGRLAVTGDGEAAGVAVNLPGGRRPEDCTGERGTAS